MLVIVKVLVITLAAGAAVLGLWGTGVRKGRLTSQGIVLLALILAGAVFSIVEAAIGASKEKREARRHSLEIEAERHWASLEAQKILGLHVSVFVKRSATVPRFVDLLRSVRLSSECAPGQYTEYWTVERLPQLEAKSYTWEEVAEPANEREDVAWLWTFYPKEPGYWWKSTSQRWDEPEIEPAGVDVNVPWKGAATLGELASLSSFGMTLPWELVELGIEDVSLQFRMPTRSLDLELSDFGVRDLSRLHDIQRAAVPDSSYLPLGVSLSGSQLLDALRQSFIRLELDEEPRKSGRGISGLTGPDGRSVRFFPEMPRDFMRSEQSKEYDFKVSVPAPKHDR